MIRLAAFGLGLVSLVGCAHGDIPDPAPVARQFARACERGDAAAVRTMLGDDERRAHDEASVRAMLAEAGAPGRARCHALAKQPLVVDGTAVMQYATGESATVVVEHGQARIAAAGAMPGGGATPEAALASFRSSLLRWLAGSSLGPLTLGTQERTSERLRSLARGLANPLALFVEVVGDRAKVDVDPGHVVHLRRETGLWRVEAFE